ncbi:MFS transporter [Planomonospora venezuelensis]|uniref:Putative MFS family arabinose efflux permease n=1 Tax=Planomonospora venezuelensis TaxID=1999 RepID=A0A841CRM3_PLAVE|nr:MFS transporter [Planomonospora venezuelensis]MBB5961092.1 putative MFS family arabinose efflux permease [Planomonospora venezuelensis]GIM99761.1 MFS transporter [Planomonospora venezuelensis]
MLASSWLTNLGDGIAAAAGPLLVATLTRDPLMISLSALVGWAPPLLFGLHAGVLSDRHDRRRIVLVANAVRAVVLAVLVALTVTGTVTVATALAALALRAVAEVFADNATATLTPMMVDRDDLVIANARLGTGFITLNQLAGAPIGAALFGLGFTWPFAGQLLLVLAAITMVRRITLPPHGRQADTPKPDTVRELIAGFRWTVRHAAVRTLVLTILIFNFTFGAAWSVLILYTQEQLGLGAIGFGLMTTVGGIGGLIGTGLYGAITRRVSLGGLMRIGLIIETFTHLGLALTHSPWVAGGIFLAFGAHAFIWGTTSVAVRQRAVPRDLQGRVGSVNTICVYAGLVVGSLIGGVLATRFGVAAPFWFAFAGSAVFVVLLWRQLVHIAHDD